MGGGEESSSCLFRSGKSCLIRGRTAYSRRRRTAHRGDLKLDSECTPHPHIPHLPCLHSPSGQFMISIQVVFAILAFRHYLVRTVFNRNETRSGPFRAVQKMLGTHSVSPPPPPPPPSCIKNSPRKYQKIVKPFLPWLDLYCLYAYFSKKKIVQSFSCVILLNMFHFCWN